MVEYSEVHEDLGAKCDSLENDVANLETALAAAKECIKGHGYCGMHGLFRCSDEDTPCPSCALAAAQERIAELENNLAAADKGLLKASDPNSGWQGINKECKLWQEKAEKAETKLIAAQERERVLRNAATGLCNIAELLIGRGEVNGPISLQGWCMAVREALERKEG